MRVQPFGDDAVLVELDDLAQVRALDDAVRAARVAFAASVTEVGVVGGIADAGPRLGWPGEAGRDEAGPDAAGQDAAGRGDAGPDAVEPDAAGPGDARPGVAGPDGAGLDDGPGNAARLNSAIFARKMGQSGERCNDERMGSQLTRHTVRSPL